MTDVRGCAYEVPISKQYALTILKAIQSSPAITHKMMNACCSW